jgi:homogentisate 1,2-dioxygenase
MPFYHKLGEIPRVKHTTFFKPDGKSLYREELVSSKGFSGIYATKYRHSLPTALLRSRELEPAASIDWPEHQKTYYHFLTDNLAPEGDFIDGRKVVLRNASLIIAVARVAEDTERFFSNALAAEYIFIHRGSGRFRCDQGLIEFTAGDQIIVPRTTIYRLEFDDYSADNKLLIVESDTAFEIPKHYKNEYGQFEEHAPYCERDFRPPSDLETIDEKGEYVVILKSGDRLFERVQPHHPFDVVGWDGHLYPYAFNIKDYHPKVGRIHLPPPVHLAWMTGSFIICNFVPRPFDFGKNAIGAPYFHSNIDSDEVLYYVEGDFMSRKGVKEGSITLHPGGMPHGPQPGKTEGSIGVENTEEYAVMIDTYRPLEPTKFVEQTIDEDYANSWLE